MIESIDHLVLTVGDIDCTCGFYVNVLGMELVSFQKTRKALKFGQQKINLHELGKEYEPKARFPTPGSADLCFVSSVPIEEWQRELAKKGVEIEEGPVERTGARGPIRSIYLRDPDGNLIEISNYLE